MLSELHLRNKAMCTNQRLYYSEASLHLSAAPNVQDSPRTGNRTQHGKVDRVKPDGLGALAPSRPLVEPGSDLHKHRLLSQGDILQVEKVPVASPGHKGVRGQPRPG